MTRRDEIALANTPAPGADIIDQLEPLRGDVYQDELNEVFRVVYGWEDEARTEKGEKARRLVLRGCLRMNELSASEIAEKTGVSKAYVSQSIQQAEKRFGLRHPSKRTKGRQR